MPGVRSTAVLVAVLLAAPGVEGQVLSNDGGGSPEAADLKALSLLVQEREAMDQLLWRPEILAQEYEAVLVEFWDALRAAKPEDRLPLFTVVPFRAITVGAAGEGTGWENGLTHREGLDRPGVSLTLMEWVERVRAFDPAEWGVAGAEWRHVSFLPALDDRGAQSVVEYELQVLRRGAERERLLVNGTLRISWNLDYGDDGRPRIDEVDAREFTVTSRPDEPWWETVVRRPADPAGEGGDALLGPVLVRDLNRDGLPEVILGGQNRILWNKGSFRFEEARLFAGDERVLHSGVVEDFNGDGQMDVLGVDADGAAWLLKGRSEGRLDRVAERPWMEVAPAAGPMTAGDVDGDGDLDIWFAPYKEPYRGGQLPTPYYDANDGHPAALWINDGNGTFTDGTAEAGLEATRGRRSRSASLVDLDRDGDLDLLQVSDFAGLDIHRNDGTGRFTEAGAAFCDERHAFGSGHAFGDFDRDGMFDFFMAGRTSSAASRLNGLGIKRDDFLEHGLMRRPMSFGNRLYLARGERFLQTGANEGCARAGWSWGVAALDLENDGDEELFVATGHRSGLTGTDYASHFWRHDVHLNAPAEDPTMAAFLDDDFRDERMRGVDEGLISWGGHQHNRFYLNREGTGFRELGFLFGLADPADCRQVVAADLDADGREDLLVVRQSVSHAAGPALRQTMLIHRNITPRHHHWLGVRLRGRAGTPVQGARVIVEGDFGKREHVVVSGDSFLAQHPAVAFFGLGPHQRVARVEVRWPGGTTTIREDVGADRYLLLRPPAP